MPLAPPLRERVPASYRRRGGLLEESCNTAVSKVIAKTAQLGAAVRRDRPALSQHHCTGGRADEGDISQMRKLAVLAVGLPIACAAYAVWPVASALQINHAIKTGDVTTLERLVLWEPVRVSLKASLAHIPAMQIAGDERRLTRGQAMPSIWARVKTAAAPIMLDRLIDTYVTAEGVTQLHQMRGGTVLSVLGLNPQTSQAENETGSERRRPAYRAMSATPNAGQRPSTSDGTNIASRLLTFYAGLRRARFHSLSLAEFEIADTANTGRRIVSQFALSNFEWKLVSVRIISASS